MIRNIFDTIRQGATDIINTGKDSFTRNNNPTFQDSAKATNPYSHIAPVPSHLVSSPIHDTIVGKTSKTQAVKNTVADSWQGMKDLVTGQNRFDATTKLGHARNTAINMPGALWRHGVEPLDPSRPATVKAVGGNFEIPFGGMALQAPINFAVGTGESILRGAADLPMNTISLVDSLRGKERDEYAIPFLNFKYFGFEDKDWQSLPRRIEKNMEDGGSVWSATIMEISKSVLDMSIYASYVTSFTNAAASYLTRGGPQALKIQGWEFMGKPKTVEQVHRWTAQKTSELEKIYANSPGLPQAKAFLNFLDDAVAGGGNAAIPTAKELLRLKTANILRDLGSQSPTVGSALKPTITNPILQKPLEALGKTPLGLSIKDVSNVGGPELVNKAANAKTVDAFEKALTPGDIKSITAAQLTVPQFFSNVQQGLQPSPIAPQAKAAQPTKDVLPAAVGVQLSPLLSGGSPKLNELISGEIFEGFPELQDLQVRITGSGTRVGSFIQGESLNNSFIKLSEKDFFIVKDGKYSIKPGKEEELVSTLAEEIHHAKQTLRPHPDSVKGQPTIRSPQEVRDLARQVKVDGADTIEDGVMRSNNLSEIEAAYEAEKTLNIWKQAQTPTQGLQPSPIAPKPKVAQPTHPSPSTPKYTESLPQAFHPQKKSLTEAATEANLKITARSYDSFYDFKDSSLVKGDGFGDYEFGGKTYNEDELYKLYNDAKKPTLNEKLVESFGPDAVGGNFHISDYGHVNPNDFTLIDDRGYVVRRGFIDDPFIKELKKRASLEMTIQNQRSLFAGFDNRDALEIKQKGFGPGLTHWLEERKSIAAMQQVGKEIEKGFTSNFKKHGINPNNKKQGEKWILAMEDRLPKIPENQNYYDAVEDARKIYDGIHELLDIGAQRMGLDPVGRVENYMTHIYAGADFQLNLDKYKTFGDYLKKGPLSPYIKERTADLPDKLREMRPKKLINAYIEAALNQIYLGPMYDSNKAIVDALRKSGKMSMAEQLESINKLTFGREATKLDEGLFLGKGTVLRQVATKGLEAKTTGSLGSKASFNAATQPLSLLTRTIVEIGPVNTIRGIGDLINHHNYAVRLKTTKNPEQLAAKHPKLKESYDLIEELKNQPLYKIKMGAQVGTTGSGDIESRLVDIGGRKVEHIREAMNFVTNLEESELYLMSAAGGYRMMASEAGIYPWEGKTNPADRQTALDFGGYIGEVTQSAYGPLDRAQQSHNLTLRANVAQFQTFKQENLRYLETIAIEEGGIPVKGMKQKVYRAGLVIATSIAAMAFLAKTVGRTSKRAAHYFIQTFTPYVGDLLVWIDHQRKKITDEEGYPGMEPGTGVSLVDDTRAWWEAFKIYNETGEMRTIKNLSVFWFFGFAGFGGAQFNVTTNGIIDAMRGYAENRRGGYGYDVEGIDKFLTIVLGPQSTSGFQDAYQTQKTPLQIEIEKNEPKTRGEIRHMLDSFEKDPFSPFTSANTRGMTPLQAEIARAEAKEGAFEKQSFVVKDKTTGEETRKPSYIKRDMARVKGAFTTDFWSMPEDKDRNRIQLMADFFKAAGVDAPNAWKALTTDEKLGIVEGDLVQMQRFYDRFFSGKKGSQEFIKLQMTLLGIPSNMLDEYYGEHIVPVSAGGDNSWKNFIVERREIHKSYTPVDTAAGDAVKNKVLTRKEVEKLMWALKVDYLITLEDAARAVKSKQDYNNVMRQLPRGYKVQHSKLLDVLVGK